MGAHFEVNYTFNIRFSFLCLGFLKIKPEIFAGGDYFEISFEFKTDQLNALLLFAYDVRGKDFILVSLLKHKQSSVTLLVHY